MYGIGAMPIPGFGAHVVEPDRPFISETGFRSFVGYNPDLPPGTTPDAYAKLLIEHYLDRDARENFGQSNPNTGRDFRRRPAERFVTIS